MPLNVSADTPSDENLNTRPSSLATAVKMNKDKVALMCARAFEIDSVTLLWQILKPFHAMKKTKTNEQNRSKKDNKEKQKKVLEMLFSSVMINTLGLKPELNTFQHSFTIQTQVLHVVQSSVCLQP